MRFAGSPQPGLAQAQSKQIACQMQSPGLRCILAASWFVIGSEAKQSRNASAEMVWIASLAMTAEAERDESAYAFNSTVLNSAGRITSSSSTSSE